MPKKAKPRVLLIDDDPDMHEGMRIVLDDFSVISAHSGQEALEIVRSERFPVVVLDLNLTGMDGIEPLRQLRQIDEVQKVIVLTGYDSKESAIASLNLGAFRYILKPFRLGEFIAILREALERHRLKSAAFSGHLEGSESLHLLQLSQREAEVVFWAVQGESHQEISERLSISTRTVEKHLQRAFDALQVSSRSKLGPRIRELAQRGSVSKRQNPLAD